jgi:YbbR domain-containing protein
VNSSNINQVTMTVQLGERASRTIDDVKLRFKNNVNNYKVSHPENKTTTSVTVYGTAENIEKITAADINVYIDMLDAKPGLMQFPLQVDQPTNGLVRYSLTESTYELNVLGETNDGTDDNKGADVNNG